MPDDLCRQLILTYFKLRIFYILTASYSKLKHPETWYTNSWSIYLSDIFIWKICKRVLSYHSFPGVICQACSLSSQEKEISHFLLFLFYPFIWETFQVNWACLHTLASASMGRKDLLTIYWSRSFEIGPNQVHVNVLLILYTYTVSFLVTWLTVCPLG